MERKGAGDHLYILPRSLFFPEAPLSSPWSRAWFYFEANHTSVKPGPAEVLEWVVLKENCTLMFFLMHSLFLTLHYYGGLPSLHQANVSLQRNEVPCFLSFGAHRLSILDFTPKCISSFAMMEHQPCLASQLRTIWVGPCPSREDPPSSAWLLEWVVQTQQACEEEESHRKSIWTPSGLGKQSQILHGAVEPDLGSHPPSQKTSAMAQDTQWYTHCY